MAASHEEARLARALVVCAAPPDLTYYAEQRFPPVSKSGAEPTTETGLYGAEERVRRTELLLDVRAALHALTVREHAVLAFRYGIYDARPLNLRQIGRLLHLTGERVRQIEEKALKRLWQHAALACREGYGRGFRRLAQQWADLTARNPLVRGENTRAAGEFDSEAVRAVGVWVPDRRCRCDGCAKMIMCCAHHNSFDTVWLCPRCWYSTRGEPPEGEDHDDDDPHTVS